MAEYDKLTIKVEADSKQANTSIKNLSSSLQHLDETAKGLDTKRIIEVKGLLQSIAKIDFSNVIKGLQSVVSAFKAFNSKAYQKSINNAGAMNIPPKAGENEYTPNFEIKSWAYSNDTNLAKVKEDFANINELVKVNINQVGEANKGYEQVYYELDKVRQGFDFAFGAGTQEKIIDGQATVENLEWTLKDIEQQLRGKGFTDEQISATLRSIRKEMSLFNDSELQQMRRTLLDMGISAEMVDKYISHLHLDTKKLNSEIKNTGEEVKKLDKNAQKASTNGLKKLITQFTRIMRYRVMRKIIQEIYKALQEGVQNVSEFDKGMQESMSKLTSAFTFLKNSIGAFLAPIIQIITPALEGLMLIVGELGNAFAEFNAKVNGQDTFSKATYELKEWNKEAKKTQTLGIDELNIISQDDKGGFTTEQVNLGEKENELAVSLKETFDKIREAFEPVVTAFRDLVDRLLPAIARLLTPISKIIGMIADLVSTLIEETYESANNSLLNVANALTAIFDVVASIMDALSPALQDIIKVVAHVINIINGTLGQTHKIIGDIFNGIKPIIHAVGTILAPIIEGIAWVLQRICDFIDYINDNWIAKAWEEIKSWFTIGVDDRTKARANTRSFATGGFPEDGFFFANHNELVGQFSNGQTAVANNQQITQGIYEAVLQAMRESGGNQDVIINLDGNELARVVTKRQNNFGADVLLGGNINWGK